MASGNTSTVEPNERSDSFTDETVQLLSMGILQNCKPALGNVKKQLTELTDKQNALIDRMHEQNLELSAVHHSSDLLEMFSAIKIYQNKLVNIKKDMRSIHEKSTKLKKRALRLQQHSEKKAYIKQQQKETRTKQEEALINQPSTSSSR